ncbi:hypothetical protein [Amycolatopsis sp. PS_44_ISF1]|uniref:hypothetical protein n=1 Tax=Amycolatopsis sp. PS_44_ISF1 TaxID=2974917 RepID=UPI0028DFCF58|nr:hypothetical protein [Amycolatopsis sp. PS_44_ISF1]MDT8909406.1 hypothetical protein [Amycolatopsis sp. PS_44_ISF1]
MRNPLGPVVVALVGTLALAGCAGAPAAPEDSSPTPLTASAALGEFTTLDYCSLLDVGRLRGATADRPDSSFDSCRGEFVQNGRHREVAVGPLRADADPNVKPYYGYPGVIPDGLAVAESSFDADTSCARVITFADGIRLNVAVTDSAGPSANADRCADADATVSGVFAAISGNHVRHQDFADRSWGRVDACALLSGPDLDAVSGAGAQPAVALSGHSCIRGRLSVKFSVEPSAPAGPTEVLGGRSARVAADGAFCHAIATQPAPGAAGRGEQVEVDVVDTSGSAGDAACADTRTAAAVVFAKVP